MNVLLLLALALLAFVALVAYAIRLRNMQIWLPAYLRQVFGRAPRRAAHTHVYFAFCDHYEPFWGKAEVGTARRRVERWLQTYPEVADRHADSDGRAPLHTFFYPAEEYDEVILDGLAGLCRRGLGDIEVHLHHDNDTAENLTRTLNDYKHLLHDRHGMLRKDPLTGQIQYAFIHGNWALDNSRPDGRWCGVNNELQVLLDTGCRVDMTMPSAPSDTQTRKINSIYFAHGVPGHCKAHDHGTDAAVGRWAHPHEMLLVQGPLALNWSSRKLGLVPRIESSEVSADNPATAARVRLWEQAAITVKGAEDHLFIKVHTHGAEEQAATALLNGGLEVMWSELERQFRDRPGYSLHYVSAWEMYERIRTLCQSRPSAAA